MKLSYFTPYQKESRENPSITSKLKRICFFTLVFISPIYSQNPRQSIMDINNITSWVGEDGFHDWLTKSRGEDFCSIYPKGTGGVLYTEGIIWGGKIFDGGDKIIRVNGCNYSSGNSAITRLYRVRADYFNTDLTDDASNFFSISKNQVNDSMVTVIYNQYEKDWNEWPADKGAPFYDINKNGKYESDIDIPGVPGASQTIWINYNDSNSYRMYGSPSIGLDIRETYWAYAYTGILSNMIYKKVNIIYKGTQTTPTNAKIDSMYIVQYCDNNIGNYFDDFAGCDTSLNLGYTYNAYPTDILYNDFNLAPPAVGYSFIQGVAQRTNNLEDSAIINFRWKRGYKYVNKKFMSSFVYFGAGTAWADPSYDYGGSLDYYNFMKGLIPPGIPFPKGIADITHSGTYLLDGDPVSGTGKIDGNIYASGDSPGTRRIILDTGPFNMKLNDTVEVVLALAGGLGSSNLNSITKLRNNVKGAITEYYNFVNALTSGQFSIDIKHPPLSNLNPENYIMYQNYPNPFNSTTVIKYELPDDAHVKLVVYDILGRVVKTLVDEEKAAGKYEVKFNADNLSSGIYFCKISFNNSKSKLVYDNLIKINKLLLIK